MKFFRVFLGLLLLLGSVSLAQAQTFPPLTGRVADAANLLTPEQEAQLTQLSADIEQASSRQFVVATIPDLQGHTIEDYGYKLGRTWKIGQGEANNGIVLIVAPNERQVRIEVGYGLEPIMTDALSSVIINTVILPRFKAGDIAGGIIDGANAIAEQMKLPPEAAEVRAKKMVTQQKSSNQGGGGGAIAIFWVIVAIFVIFPMVFGRARGRRYRGGIAPVVLWGSGLGGGGSGWGGGSSWGGGSGWGGGGGGGFSGGGGSFGGGGASGGW